MSTGIEWTDETWNPTTGCDRVSPGCDHCYAATMAARLKGMGQPKYQRDGDPRTSGPGFGLTEHPDVLDQPLRWRKPRKVFVNSMSDLFHPRVTDEFIARVFDVMGEASQHTFQVLTKRPKRMRAWVRRYYDCDHGGDPTGECRYCRPHPNVWLGTSVEDQQRADERIPALLDAPAAVRFLSCEPLLGPVDLARWVPRAEIIGDDGQVHYRVPVNHPILTEQLPNLQRARPNTGYHARPEAHPDPYLHPGPFVDWVIVGGESGSGARPMHPDWVDRLRDQCAAAGVPFLFKQWGAWQPVADVYDEDLDVGDLLGRHVAAVETSGDVPQEHLADDHTYRIDHQPAPGSWWMERVGKKAAGRELDGRTWVEFPETAEVTA